MMPARSPLCAVTIDAAVVAAPNVVLSESKEIKATKTGHHPSALGELAYSVDRFVLILTKENFWHSFPPRAIPISQICSASLDVQESLGGWTDATDTTCEGKSNFMLAGKPLTLFFHLWLMICRSSITENMVYSINRLVSIKKIWCRKIFLFITCYPILKRKTGKAFVWCYACMKIRSVPLQWMKRFLRDLTLKLQLFHATLCT